MKRQVRFSVILGIYILLPVVIASVLVASVMEINSHAAVQDAALLFGDETIAHIRTRVEQFLVMPKLINALNADALQSGRVPHENQFELESLFLSRVRFFPSVTGVKFANAGGGYVSAGREGPGGETWVIRTDNPHGGSQRTYRTGDNGTLEAVIASFRDLDVRTLNWYRKALAAGGPAWTEPYMPDAGRDRAISAVHPLYLEDGSVLGVLAVDIFLSQLGEFLTGMSGNLGGVCLISDREGSPVAVSSTGAVIADLLAEAKRYISLQDDNSPGDAVVHGQFESGGERYYLNVTSVPASIGLDWYIMTMYPESAFMTKLRNGTGTQYLLVFFVLILCVLMSQHIASIFTKPVRRLTEYTRLLSKGEWPGNMPPMSISEMEALRKSFYTMQSELKRSIDRLNVEISDKDAANRKVQALLEEKTLLLREVHHRMKNNMASIQSLLSLQVKSLENTEAVNALNDTIGRISSMQVLYEKMLISERYQEISLKSYLEDLIDAVLSLFPQRRGISVLKRIDNVTMNSKRLFSLGIIVNELLTNALKYAFPDRSAGMVIISVTRVENLVTLVMEDNGIGLPAGFDTGSSRGFGLMLVRILCEQISARFTIHASGGTISTVEFELSGPAPLSAPVLPSPVRVVQSTPEAP